MASVQLYCRKSAKVNQIAQIFRQNSVPNDNRIHLSFQPFILDCCENFDEKEQIFQRVQVFLKELHIKNRKIILITNNLKACNLSRIPRALVPKVRIQNANLDRINSTIKWITNKVEREGVDIRVRRDRRNRIMTRSYQSITAIHLEDLNMLEENDYCRDNGAHLARSGYEKVNTFVQTILQENN